jgi:hypothetical protein
MQAELLDMKSCAPDGKNINIAAYKHCCRRSGKTFRTVSISLHVKSSRCGVKPCQCGRERLIFYEIHAESVKKIIALKLNHAW